MDVLFQCYTFNNTSRISNALIKRHLYSTNACTVINFRDMDKREETMDSKPLVDSTASASVEKIL